MDRKPSTLFQIIHELSTQAHSIQLLCHLAKVSRSGYYKWVTDITYLIFNGQKLYCLPSKTYIIMKLLPAKLVDAMIIN